MYSFNRDRIVDERHWKEIKMRNKERDFTLNSFFGEGCQ